MNKRVFAAIAAGVLALLGVLVLMMYAQGADDRAFEGAKLVPVVRLTQDVKIGTTAADLAASTEVVKLPDESVPDGAVTSLDQVKGLSTNASVQAGEVLLKSRMGKAGDKDRAGGSVPAGFQEVTIALDAERSVGGSVKAGDTVGVVVTTEGRTNFTLNQVLVTRAQAAIGGADSGSISGMMVTLAVKALDAERIVHGQKWGIVWLTMQNADTDTAGSKPITIEDVLR